ncbi:ribosome assembly RNA-binding protein YhbY [uncultured Desulfosarcina sp.]|uniref:ribosome assembly RNA-binding protein YhbY n=1 Tax=uncultured Desulfosarcina sp. TaxID=218289 RepID=UPI0029C97554|nr:ribosome assembly RNA-binding protein YhbY [uncultured Desulfosarcina sp.]
MEAIKGFQKRFLRGLAHALKPVVFVGQKGFSPTLVKALDEALDQHELVKVKFVEFKEKEKKAALIQQLEKAVECELVGLIGHTATFYRQQADPDKRKIVLPSRAIKT